MSGSGEQQQASADIMSEAWRAFARTGNSSHEGLLEWGPYTVENRATMNFHNTPRLMHDLRQRERAILYAAL